MIKEISLIVSEQVRTLSNNEKRKEALPSSIIPIPEKFENDVAIWLDELACRRSLFASLKFPSKTPVHLIVLI
jgi:hypothetical protein